MNKHKGISPDFLKLTAIITMLIDHTSHGLVKKFAQYVTDAQKYNHIASLSQTMNSIGRLAFPIFAYQLVQGFIYTKDRIKYARNLLIFALLSEFPFDLGLFGKPVYYNHQNVMFELLSGLIMLMAAEYVNDRFFGVDFARDAGVWNETEKAPVFKAVAADIIIAIVFLVPAQLLHLDYGGKGIVLIMSIYVLYRFREVMCILCPVLFIASFYPVNHFLNGYTHESALKSMANEIPSCISFFLIYFDNGIRKIKGRRKYIFYAFYPVHLILIWGIRSIIAVVTLFTSILK